MYCRAHQVVSSEHPAVRLVLQQDLRRSCTGTQYAYWYAYWCRGYCVPAQYSTLQQNGSTASEQYSTDALGLKRTSAGPGPVLFCGTGIGTAGAVPEQNSTARHGTLCSLSQWFVS